MKKLLLFACLLTAISWQVKGSSVQTPCRVDGYYRNHWYWTGDICENCTYFNNNCQTTIDYDYSACYRRLGPPPCGGANRVSTNTTFFNLRERMPETNPTVNLRGGLMTPVSITNADMQALFDAGKVHYDYVFKHTTSFSMNIGTADDTNPQTWTLPSNLLTMVATTSLEHFIEPSEVTPAAAQEPDATHVSKSTSVDDDGNNLIRYSHYDLGIDPDDDLYDLGTTFVNSTNQVVDFGEAAHVYADAPFDLGDDFITEETEYDDEDELPKTVYSRHVVVDAFGTINNPFGSGTFDCLRMSVAVTENRYETDLNTPSTTITNYFVGWIAQNGFRFFAQKPAVSSSGTVTLNGGFEMNRVTSEAILDVELLRFEGTATEEGNVLTWTTANEKNNAGFEIERSTDGQKFEKIGFVKGNGTTKDKKNYSFSDKTPLSKTVYYRLQQVDFDGSKVHSNVISIEPNYVGKGLKVYPNPTNGHEITLEIPENTEGVQVINSLGQVVFNQKVENMKTLKMDTNQWANGIYFIKTAKENIKLIKN